MAVEYIHLLTLLMGTADCHEISKVFSVPGILEAGYISLPGLHQIGTDNACVAEEQRNLHFLLL